MDTEDDDIETGLDGSGLVRAFERAKGRALAGGPGETERQRAEWVLEATAYAVALEVIGRLGSIDRADREALAARARRTLLSLAALVSAADEDGRDALDLAARYAREGLRVLGNGAVEAKAGDEAPPPVRDLVRLVRGDLDGFASADVALRLRGSTRGRAELARIVPSIVSPARARFRVAADTLSLEAASSATGAPAAGALRDPREGRAVGSQSLDVGALEAFVFPDRALAIYADPPLPLRVSGLGITGGGVEMSSSSPGYVELRGIPEVDAVTLRVEYGDLSFEWTLTLA